MKKFILISIIALFAGLSLQAQRTITADTLDGVETINFTSMQGAKFVTVEVDEIGGTSDGTLTLYGSTNGTVWTFINMLLPTLGVASPKASITGADLNQITITDALNASWYIPQDTYPFHRITAVGTSGDTTRLAIHWSKHSRRNR